MQKVKKMTKGVRLKAVIGLGILMILGSFGGVATVLAQDYTPIKGGLIAANCSKIQEDLREVQKSDAKARLYLGRHYETIITKYVKALNVKLVENNMPNTALLENQTNLTAEKMRFASNFVEYQKGLEELAGVDCRTEPEGFYVKLQAVREMRATVRADVESMDALILRHKQLVKELIEVEDVE